MQLLGQALAASPAGLLAPPGVSLTRVTLPVLQVLFFSLIHMVSLQQPSHALLAQWYLGRRADVCCPLQLFNGYSESSIVVGCAGHKILLAHWPAGLGNHLSSAFCCTIG